jgi:hypothetical protein
VFGGLGFLLNGNMCVGVWKDSLIARVGSEDGRFKRRPSVRDFDITGRAMSGWILMDEQGWRNPRQFSEYLQCARRFVDTLPGK